MHCPWLMAQTNVADCRGIFAGVLSNKNMRIPMRIFHPGRWGFLLLCLRTRDTPLSPPSTWADIFRQTCLHIDLQTSDMLRVCYHETLHGFKKKIIGFQWEGPIFRFLLFFFENRRSGLGRLLNLYKVFIATTQPATQNDLKQILSGWYYYQLKKKPPHQDSLQFGSFQATYEANFQHTTLSEHNKTKYGRQPQ